MSEGGTIPADVMTLKEWVENTDMKEVGKYVQEYLQKSATQIYVIGQEDEYVVDVKTSWKKDKKPKDDGLFGEYNIVRLGKNAVEFVGETDYVWSFTNTFFTKDANFTITKKYDDSDKMAWGGGIEFAGGHPDNKENRLAREKEYKKRDAEWHESMKESVKKTHPHFSDKEVEEFIKDTSMGPLYRYPKDKYEDGGKISGVDSYDLEKIIQLHKDLKREIYEDYVDKKEADEVYKRLSNIKSKLKDKIKIGEFYDYKDLGEYIEWYDNKYDETKYPYLYNAYPGGDGWMVVMSKVEFPDAEQLDEPTDEERFDYEEGEEDYAKGGLIDKFSKSKIDEIVNEDYLNEAMCTAQDHIGVDDGGVCGMYFSKFTNEDETWKKATRSERVKMLKEYLKLEDSYTGLAKGGYVADWNGTNVQITHGNDSKDDVEMLTTMSDTWKGLDKAVSRLTKEYPINSIKIDLKD